jgi:hypothetical protein
MSAPHLPATFYLAISPAVWVPANNASSRLSHSLDRRKCQRDAQWRKRLGVRWHNVNEKEEVYGYANEGRIARAEKDTRFLSSARLVGAEGARKRDICRGARQHISRRPRPLAAFPQNHPLRGGPTARSAGRGVGGGGLEYRALNIFPTATYLSAGRLPTSIRCAFSVGGASRH